MPLSRWVWASQFHLRNRCSSSTFQRELLRISGTRLLHARCPTGQEFRYDDKTAETWSSSLTALHLSHTFGARFTDIVL